MNCEYCGAPAPQAASHASLYRELREENGRLTVENEELQKENDRLLQYQNEEHTKYQEVYRKFEKQKANAFMWLTLVIAAGFFIALAILGNMLG